MRVKISLSSSFREVWQRFDAVLDAGMPAATDWVVTHEVGGRSISL
jgi:hypothetical protein